MITNMAMDITPKTDTIEPGKDTENKEVSLDPSEWQLPEETIVALSELGDIYRRIRTRMHAEGYTLVNGKVEKLPTAKF